jgi:hypothetical protein
MQKLHSILAIQEEGVIGCNRRIVKLQTVTALKSKATQVSPSEYKKNQFMATQRAPSTQQQFLQAQHSVCCN